MKYRFIVLVNICLVALFWQGCYKQNQSILDRWETKAHSFTLRISEFQESRFPLSKFKYVFETKLNGSDEWREIMTAVTDDDIPIPRDQVQLISNKVTYAFMLDQYAVTSDGGETWSMWKVNNNAYPGQFVIKQVLMDPNGTGTLVVASRYADKQTMKFRTDDFGRSWVAQ